MSRARTRLRTPWLDSAAAAQLPGTSRARRPPPGRPLLPSPPPVASARVPPWASAAGFVCGVVVLVCVALAAGGNKEALGAIVTAPLLLLLTWACARKIAQKDQNPQLVAILMGAYCLKLVGSLARYWVSASIYGTGDFYDYDKWGRRIAAGLRHGHLISLQGRLAGTNFMRLVTGFIYFATPSRMMSGFLVYGWLSFVGFLFFWRAYRIAISSTRDITYLKWVLLLPSLLYWPSAIGKDAFMVLTAGIAAYGVACLLTGRLTVGLAAISIGIAGMSMVRPHFALAVCGGLIVAVALRRQRGGVMQAVVTIVFTVAVGLLLVQTASSFFGISAFNRSSVVKALNETSTQTGQGGSAYSPVVVSSPINFPLAAVTVLYRPFPLEAHSAQEMLTAIEGVGLGILSLRALKKVLRALRSSRDFPYLLYCLGALFVFIVAFSGFSNFGILARQRTIIQPLFLVFLALPGEGDLGNRPVAARGDRRPQGALRAPL